MTPLEEAIAAFNAALDAKIKAAVDAAVKPGLTAADVDERTAAALQKLAPLLWTEDAPKP